MGRASRKGTGAAEVSPGRGHWTESHPDRELWTPHQQALAENMSQEAYEAVYGRGQAAEAEQIFVGAETDFVRGIRSGELRPNREQTAAALVRFIEDDIEAWEEHFEVPSPLRSENSPQIKGTLALAKKQADAILARIEDKSLPREAASALALGLHRDLQRLVLALTAEKKSSLSERTFSQKDDYLFEKILPALYYSDDKEDFTVSDNNLHMLIEEIVASRSVQDRWGTAEDHRRALLGEINNTNPALSESLREGTRNLLPYLGRQIGLAGGDRGYVDFIQLGDTTENDDQGFPVCQIKENALRASKDGLSHLLANQVGAALLLSGEISNGQERLFDFEDEGGEIETLLRWREGEASPMEMIRATGIFGSATGDIEDLWEERCQHHKDALGDDDWRQIMSGLVADAVCDASRRYVESFQSQSGPPLMTDLLFLELQKKLQL